MTSNPTLPILIPTAANEPTEYFGFRPVRRPLRRLFVTNEVRELLDGTRLMDGFPLTADEVVGAYLSGFMVRFSRVKRKRKKGEKIELEQIEGEEEIWALCTRTPPPGWRLFGRFMDRDVLVLLTAYDKQLNGEKYAEESQRVREIWSKLYGTRAPYAGGNDIADYISGPTYDTDT